MDFVNYIHPPSPLCKRVKTGKNTKPEIACQTFGLSDSQIKRSKSLPTPLRVLYTSNAGSKSLFMISGYLFSSGCVCGADKNVNETFRK